MNDETRDRQAERRDMMTAMSELEQACNLSESSLERIESLCDFAQQREALLPTRKGERPYFQVGRGDDGAEETAHVPATLENDAWLEPGEPCVDCGAELDWEDDPVAATNRFTDRLRRVGRVSCTGCGAIYNRMPEAHRETVQSRLCSKCGLPAENNDGGPTTCFGCRAKDGTLTVCAGCGKLYPAKPHPAAVIADKNLLSELKEGQLRLCPGCTKPAAIPVERFRHTFELEERFNNLAGHYGAGGQAHRGSAHGWTRQRADRPGRAIRGYGPNKR